jgi:uncharacterized protein
MCSILIESEIQGAFRGRELSSPSMKRMPDPVRLREGLRKSLRDALSSRDTIAVAALRSAMSALDNAEAVDQSHAPGPAVGAGWNVRLGVGAGEAARRELSAQDVIEIVHAEVKDRTAAAAEYERLGRADEATRLRAEASTLESFIETALQEP